MVGGPTCGGGRGGGSENDLSWWGGPTSGGGGRRSDLGGVGGQPCAGAEPTTQEKRPLL